MWKLLINSRFHAPKPVVVYRDTVSNALRAEVLVDDIGVSSVSSPHALVPSWWAVLVCRSHCASSNITTRQRCHVS